MDRPTRLQSTTLRLSAVLGALSLIAAACAGAASPPVPTTACASVTLSVADADLEGGFLATPLAAPEAGVTVQAVLAIGGNGPQLAGRTIAYAGELAGTSAVTDSAGAVAAFEATTSGDRSGAGGCPGSVRLAIPHGQGWGKGFAWVGATLGHLDVSVASPETCTSLELGGGSVAVECPTVAVRIGEQASAGTLWLRLATKEASRVVDALPAWATVVAPPAEPSPWAPAAGFEGSVTLDGGESLPVDGGTLERSDDPELLVTLQFGKNGSTLALWISGWAGGAGDPVGGGELVLRPDDAPAEVFLGGPCPVQIGDDGGSGSFACTFTLLADEAEAQTIDVEATWATDALPEPSIETGDTVVSWHLGGGIVSQGEAIVEGRPGPAGAASVFIVPDVPLEATELGAVLRLRIVGFSGDGSYSGAAVDPAIDILTSSPLLAVPVDEPEGQPWGPILGACTATVTDGGASGTMSCPGDPSFQVDPRFGGSVTLVASWRAAT